MSPTERDPLSLLASLGGTAEDVELLDAAKAEFIAHGFRRTSIGDIARRAKVSRPTLYRRIGDKDDIVRQVVLREVAGFFMEHAALLLSATSPRERTISVFAAGIVELRRNELARAVLTYEPEVLARLVTDDSTGSVTVLRDTIAMGVSGGEPATRRHEQAAELIIRVTVSLLVQPIALFPLTDEDEARAFATTWLSPVIDAATSGD